MRMPNSPAAVGCELVRAAVVRRTGPDQRREDDDVRLVAAGVGIEFAAAGDQPQAGMVEVPVDLEGREMLFGTDFTESTENCATVPSARVTSMPSPGLEVLQVVEHPWAELPGVDVPEDDRRAERAGGRGSGYQPGLESGIVQGRHLDGPIGIATQIDQR